MEETCDELLKQEELLSEMVEKNRVLLEALEMSEEELTDLLSDQSRHSPEAWAALQRNRKLLEKAVDERIEAAKKKPKITQAKPAEIQGHWIFVR